MGALVPCSWPASLAQGLPFPLELPAEEHPLGGAPPGLLSLGAAVSVMGFSLQLRARSLSLPATSARRGPQRGGTWPSKDTRTDSVIGARPCTHAGASARLCQGRRA